MLFALHRKHLLRALTTPWVQQAQLSLGSGLVGLMDTSITSIAVSVRTENERALSHCAASRLDGKA